MIAKKFYSIKWYSDVLSFFFRVNFHFKNPPKKKLIIFDRESVSDISIILKKYDYFVLENRITNINNFYLNFKILTMIIRFYRGNFMSAYLKSIIHLVDPDHIVTFIDNSEKFFELAKYFNKKITFSAIQNGARYEINENNYLYKKKNSLQNKNTNIFFDNYFCFSNFEEDLYKKNKIQVKKFIHIGSTRLINYLEYRKNLKNKRIKKKFDICLLSDQGAFSDSLDVSQNIKEGLVLLIKHTLKFSRKFNLKLTIALKREKNHRLGDIFFKEEQDFFKENLSYREYEYAKKVFFYKNNKYNVYDLILNSKVTLGCISTCLREALSLKRKVLVCNYSGNNIYNFPLDGLCRLNNKSYNQFEKRLLKILKMNLKIFEKKCKKSTSKILNFKNLNQVYKILSKKIIINN